MWFPPGHPSSQHDRPVPHKRLGASGNVRRSLGSPACSTALAKLALLRTHVRWFQGSRPIFQEQQSPDLEKALTLLNDRLLGSTSNAVERGNRRHRKMQKTGYWVRTQQTIRGRIALDMFREIQAPPRAETMK